MSTSGNERLWQVLFLLVAALQAIITGFVAWTFSSVQDMRERVVRIETKMDMQETRCIANYTHTPSFYKEKGQPD